MPVVLGLELRVTRRWYMAYITQILAEEEFNTALANFATVCNLQAETLDLTPAQITEIQAASTALANAITAATAARTAWASAQAAKLTKLADGHALVSKYAKIFRADQTVTDAILAELMLAPHKTPGVRTTPAIPTDLVANSDGNGNITLKWHRNGNIQGTVFNVEMRPNNSAPWSIIGTTTMSKFDTTWTPGTYVEYRVSASRRDVDSAACTPVVLWSAGSEDELYLADAA